MYLRLLLPALAWLILLILILFRHTLVDLNFHIADNDKLLNGFLFLGHTYIWLGVFKKQLKFQYIRTNAFSIALISGIALAIGLELLKFGISNFFNYWNLIFAIIGIFLGIGTFHLVYRKCY